MARAPLGTMLALLLALAGCGEAPPPAHGDPWPLTLQAPGVVGYAAVRLEAAERDELSRRLVGIAPEGLDDSRPIIALSLDSKAYGGSTALLLPLRDEDDFLTALEGARGVRRVGRSEYVLDVSSDSQLGRLMAVMGAGLGSGGTLLDAVRAAADAGSQQLAFNLQVVDDWAAIAPTFEAGTACRDVLRETGGFSASPPRMVVLTEDVGRARIAYADSLQRFEDQFRGLIGGARVAGIAGLLSGMHDGGGPQIDFGVRWEFVWAVKEMLALSNLEGLQIQLPQLGGPQEPGGPADIFDALGKRFLDTRAGALRVRFSDGSPLAALVQSLRPAPDVPDALLVISADGPAFARAFAAWTRPLGRLVTGDGPPCDRYLDELAGILAGVDGTLALHVVDDDICLLASAPSAPPDLLPRLQAWFAPLLAAAGLQDADGVASGALSAREQADGRTLLVDEGGTPRVTMGRSGGVVWLRSGDAAEPGSALLAFSRALEGGAPGDGPCLRVHASVGDADVWATGRELRFDVRRIDDGR